MKSFAILGETIEPGTARVLSLDVGSLYDSTNLRIPIKVFHGSRPGPVLVVSAGIHGDEINGTEIVRRLLRKKELKTIAGTLITVPIVNVYGFNSLSRYLPDRRDLNRMFPGRVVGSMAARMAYLFVENILKKADFSIDLHTGAKHRFNLPHIRGDLSDPYVKELAENFSVPVMLQSQGRDGSLRETAGKLKIPSILYEGGEALRFDSNVTKIGVRGVLSVMKSLGMIEAVLDHPYPERRPVFIAHSSHWARAPESGMVRILRTVGASVSEGEIVGEIADPLGQNKIKILSPNTGVVIGVTRLPLVSQGDALIHVASLEGHEDFEDLFDEELYLSKIGLSSAQG